ncbi:MAG: hypothetical protein PHE32_03995 [Candidatus Shapirobacteria bacterium]|nr:hypothetical protein [Candidatus Shapirobacteria bacterium]
MEDKEKQEVGRELLGDGSGQVKITYDDGSEAIIDSPKPEPPKDLVIDSETPISSGTTFEEEQ